MDDILVYNKTLEEHQQQLQQVFSILQDNKFYLKYSKCSFAHTQMEYLGHVISGDGVATDPTKIKDVENWPPPKNIKQVRAILGLAGYYRKFIRHYGKISKRLSYLLKKNTQFIWTPQHQ
jgi:hypothetical protein